MVNEGRREKSGDGAAPAAAALGHPDPAAAEPRKTLQTTTQTDNRSWHVQGQKLPRCGVIQSTRRNHKNPWRAKLPLLLLFCAGLIGQLACVGAAPVPVSVHVEGRGRPLQGESYSLVCVVSPALDANTRPAFVWYRDSQVLVNQTGRELSFSPLSKRDQGDYQCSANTERFQRSDPFTLNVIGTYEVVNRPHLGPRGVPVLHRPFGLECLVMELPNQGVNVHLTYTWYKDHKVIEGQSDMIIDFPSLTNDDQGLYTCTARNGKPRTTSLESNALEVGVLVPPVVHMEPPEKVITVTAGDILTLTCNVTEAFPGVAADGYRWSYLPSPGGQLRPLEGKESTLTLGPLTREDSGQYICQAWNYEHFGGLLPPGNTSVGVDVMYLGNITLTSDVTVNKGDHVALTCSVDSKPAARLSWLVEGREVRHVTANVDHYVLERAACSDNKTYTCRASIPGGPERNASSHVTVNCTSNRHGKMPDQDIYIVHSKQSAVKGQSYRLGCQNAAAPDLEAGQTYVWVKDNRTLENEDGQNLTFPSVTEEDRGVYQCGRKQGQGLSLSATFELKVLNEQTPGFAEIGIPVLVGIAVLGAVIGCILRKKKTTESNTEESMQMMYQSASPDSRQQQHDTEQSSLTSHSEETP